MPLEKFIPPFFMIIPKTPFLMLTALGLFSGPLSATSVGWSYDNGYSQATDDVLDPADVAGYGTYAQANWNNHTGVTVDGQGTDPDSLPFPLNDDTGADSGIRVTAWSLNTPNSWFHDVIPVTANGRLMKSFNGHQPSLTFSSIPSNYTENGYSVVVYYSRTGAQSSSTLKIEGSGDDVRTRTITSSGAAAWHEIGFLEGTDLNTTTATNVTVFTGLQDPEFTISLTNVNDNGFCGIQIVEETGPPSAPSSPTPEDWGLGAVVTSTNLSWSPALRATSYDVYVWKDTEDEPAEPTDTVLTNLYDPAVNLDPLTYYNWRVVAKNVDGETPGPMWTFHTGDGGAPGQVSWPFPEDASTGIYANVGLYWDPADSAQSYEVYLWRSAETEPEDPVWAGEDLYYLPPTLLDLNTEYSWRVVAINDQGGTPGPEWRFTTNDFVFLDRPSIGWHYDGHTSNNTLGPAEAAGAPGFGQTNWYNHVVGGQGPPSSGFPFALTDSTGAATTARLTSWTQRTNNSYFHYEASANPQEKLMNSFADTDPRLTFSDIPEEYLSGYTVVVYYGNNEGPNASILSINGSDDDLKSRTVTTGNTQTSFYRHVGFVEGTDNNPTVPTNYSVFTGLNDPGFEVSLIRSDVNITNNNNGISAIQIVKEGDLPNPPYTSFPAEGMTEVATSINFSWDEPLRATSYEVFLWKDGDVQPEEPVASPTSAFYDPAANLDADTTYFWQVVAVNSEGSAAGPIWSFTTGANLPPALATNPTPADSATGVTLDTLFDWDVAARAVTYELYIWETSEGPGAVTATTSVPGFTPTVPFEPGKSYSWRVDTTNGLGTTSGTTWTFTTGTAAAIPSEPSPADLATDVPRIVELDWADSLGATSYNVYLWPSSEGTPEEPIGTTTASNYTPTILLAANTVYSWRIDPVNEFGATTGTVWAFTTSSVVSEQESIGWNGGHGMTTNDAVSPDEIAGAPGFKQAYWNNHEGVGQGAGPLPFALTDNTGAASGVEVTEWIVDANSWHNNYSGTDPNGKLMNAFSDKNPQITFSGIPEDYTTEGYTVVVYYGQNEGPSVSELSVTGNDDDFMSRLVRTGSVPGQGQSAWQNIGYVEGTDNSDTTSAGPLTNYGIFTGLNDDEITVSLLSDPANNNGIMAIQIIKGVIEIPVGSDYDNWALENDLEGADADFDADPDNDGISNGIEFVIGGQPNPALPGSNSNGLLIPVQTGENNLIFTFTRTHASASLNPLVEFSATLDGDWTEAVDGVNATVSVTPGVESDTVTVTIPKNGADKLFARLRVNSEVPVD